MARKDLRLRYHELDEAGKPIAPPETPVSPHAGPGTSVPEVEVGVTLVGPPGDAVNPPGAHLPASAYASRGELGEKPWGAREFEGLGAGRVVTGGKVVTVEAGKRKGRERVGAVEGRLEEELGGHGERAEVRRRLRQVWEKGGAKVVERMMAGEATVVLYGECRACGAIEPWPEQAAAVRRVWRGIEGKLEWAQRLQLEALEKVLKYGVGVPNPYPSHTITPVSPEVRARLARQVRVIEGKREWETGELLAAIAEVWRTPGGEV
jgi:hypothetical protein